MSTHRHIVRSAGTIGALTGVSRVLGFVRDLVIAAAFGTGLGAEAFVVSFKIPNLLRDLVGEGAANSAFVPVLTECQEKKKADFWQLVSTLFVAMTVILAVLAVLGVCFAPQIVQLLAPGFAGSQDPEKFPLTVHLTRLIFPYIFLIGLSALAMGVLNSLKEFTASALGPALLNLSMIASGVYFEKTYGPTALVIGVLIGGVLQLAFQIPPLLKSGFVFRRPDFSHPSVKKIGKLLIPRAMGSALYQINILVDSVLASFENIVGPGGQSALYYSNRLFQLPLAIFGLSLAQALLPTFSSQAAREDIAGMKATLAMAIRSLFFIILPASVGLLVMAVPIVRIIFEHGKFDAYSTAITSSALFYYSFGLCSCAMIKIFVNAFYAMHDTKTPVKIMMISVSLNVILSALLMFPMKIGGLTLASSFSATVNMACLFWILRKKIGALPEKEILRAFGKMVLACAGMALFMTVYNHWILGAFSSSGRVVQFALLFLGIALGAGFYFICAYFLKVEEARRIFKK